MTGEFRSYKIEDAAGVSKFRAVVQGTVAGAVKKPSAENEGKFVGVTQEDQATQNRSVRVQESGRTFAVAATGTIAVGDYVRIADNVGKMNSAQADVVLAPGTAKINYVIGVARTAAAADGDIFELEIQPFVAKTAVS
jgi:hypothetical protein